MQKKYDLIVFDWDGTLADSTQLIIDAICQGCRDVGIDEPSQEAASSIIGLGFKEACLELFNGISEQAVMALMERYNQFYQAGEESIPLYEGAKELVEYLSQQGYYLGVATGKGRRGLNRALARSGIGHHFIATRCVDECFSKPHPQMIEELMQEVATEPHKTLMVGDTSFDLQMAKNAGVDRIAMTHGAHSIERLIPLEPLAHFGHLEDFHDWFKQYG
jgi:phosphoglycolate phosphatase